MEVRLLYRRPCARRPWVFLGGSARRVARSSHRGQRTTISVNGQTYACKVTNTPTRQASATEWKNT